MVLQGIESTGAGTDLCSSQYAFICWRVASMVIVERRRGRARLAVLAWVAWAWSVAANSGNDRMETAKEEEAHSLRS